MPAAAVIPAPIAYIKVVAVKKLVVGFLVERPVALNGLHCCDVSGHPSGGMCLALSCRGREPIVYCEKIRVFKAGLRLEYISME